MVTVVCIINTLIALILLYVAWRVRKLRRRLARIADKLSALERTSHKVLNGAPNAISTGRLGIHKLRQGKQSPNLQLLRVKQVLTLLGIGQQIWQRSRLAGNSKFFRKALAKYK